MKINSYALLCRGLILTVLCCSSIAKAASDPQNLCIATGYTLGYFNGVWNTPVQAANGLAALRALKGDTFNGEPVQYEAFYNHTGSVTGHTGLQDIAEVFEQRALEIDASGEFGRRWEFFWESLTGEKPLIEKIIELFPTSANLFSQLYTDITSKVMAGWSFLLSNPPTEADYATHNTRLDALAVQGQKLMLVAHSQGNLFMNHAFDYVQPKVGPDGVKAAHVAPASSTLRGNYLVADIDLVINALRVQGLSSVPAININLPTSLSDVSGHTLVGTYLDPARPARARVDFMITQAMSALVTPATTGNVGAFTVTLTWDGSGDVDLHTFEPNGSHSYYESPAGVVGYLDVDNTVANGPEHYYATCDATKLEAGTYRIGINNYARASGRIATVQVSTSRDGTLLTKSLDVGPPRGSAGDPSPIPVLAVTVMKDLATGHFTFSAN